MEFLTVFTLSFILFISNAACSDGSNNRIISALCGIDSYDVGVLKNAHSWKFTAPLIFCLDSMTNSSTCSFIFAFCRKLNYPNTPCNGSAVCQVDPKSGSMMAPKFSLAAYNPNKNPFKKPTRQSKLRGFAAVFDPGQSVVDPKTNKTRQAKVEMIFICNRNMPWISTGDPPLQVPDGAATPIWIESSYTYAIYFQYAGACIKDTPIAPHSDFSIELSIGTILVIISICSMSLYCGVGCIVKACMGSKGPNIIPNNEFWTTLPAYTKEGFMLSVAFLCCNCKNTTAGSSMSSAPQKGYDSI